jgi:CRP-like cAMP-binding protein
MQMMSLTKRKPPTSKSRGRLLNINSLYRVELPERIEAAELGLFFDKVDMQTCPAGTMLFTPEDSGERLYILKQGLVDLFRVTVNGKRLVTRKILPGSVFGIMGLLGQTIQGNFAEAAKDSTFGVITREDIIKILTQQPDVALHLLELVGKRMRLIEERLVEATYSPARVRLAHFLLVNTDSASGVLTNLTHEEIGDTIGAVRQTVTETLGLFRKQKLILIEPKRIQIINRHGLEKEMQDSGS